LNLHLDRTVECVPDCIRTYPHSTIDVECSSGQMRAVMHSTVSATALDA
jgi:hypothetical protein